jgi:hypothetical protein
MIEQPLKWINLSSNTGVFFLEGGWYSLTAIATWNSGSIVLERLAADEATFVSTTVTLNTNGIITQMLPSGVYKLVISGTPTGIYADLTHISSKEND